MPDLAARAIVHAHSLTPVLPPPEVVVTCVVCSRGDLIGEARRAGVIPMPAHEAPGGEAFVIEQLAVVVEHHYQANHPEYADSQ